MSMLASKTSISSSSVTVLEVAQRGLISATWWVMFDSFLKNSMINYLSIGKSPVNVIEHMFTWNNKKVPYFHRKFKELKTLNVTVGEVAQDPLRP